MPEHHFLNLGAGVQSTALYLMSIDGDEPEVPRFDAAIFADVQEEPDEVYKHLDYLKTLGGPPIVVTTAGRLAKGVQSERHRRANPQFEIHTRPIRQPVVRGGGRRDSTPSADAGREAGD